MTDALYCPPDIDAAHAAWGASCGPASAAALLGVTVAATRPWFPGRTTPLFRMAAPEKSAPPLASGGAAG